MSPAKKNTPNKPDPVPDAGQRVPPQAMELEIAVLGAIMLDTEAMWKVVDIIDDSCFYSAKHRKIFRAMKSLFDKQEPYDLLTVTEELKKQKQLENIGGAYYLGEILASVPTAANAEYHARVIREKSLLRNLISMSADISGECYDPSCEAEAVMEKMQSHLFQLVSAHQERRVFGHIKPFLSETFETIETYHKKKGLVTGIGTGFHALDEKTAGFQNSDLIILAARPAMGKTSLALNLARNAAIEHNVPVGLFSLEMTSQQLSLRLLCSEARVDSHKVRTGRLPDSDWQKLSKTVGKLAKAPIYLDDTASIGVLDVRTRARRAKLEHNIGMIIIDYLQLMELPRGAESQQQGIAQISRSLKALAKELNIPVIAVSQLSRAVEVRGGKRRPQLSDLRDSGAIEQDADLVLFIYRPEFYSINKVESEDGKEYNSEGIAEIIIGKNRNGPPGSVLLQFERTYVRFQDLEMKRQLIPVVEDEEIQPSKDLPF